MLIDVGFGTLSSSLASLGAWLCDHVCPSQAALGWGLLYLIRSVGLLGMTNTVSTYAGLEFLSSPRRRCSLKSPSSIRDDRVATQSALLKCPRNSKRYCTLVAQLCLITTVTNLSNAHSWLSSSIMAISKYARPVRSSTAFPP